MRMNEKILGGIEQWQELKQQELQEKNIKKY